MRAFLMLYVTDFEDDDCRTHMSTSAERRAFTVLSSVCWYWHQTLVGWPESSTCHWVRHQLKKLIESEHMLLQYSLLLCLCAVHKFYYKQR